MEYGTDGHFGNIQACIGIRAVLIMSLSITVPTVSAHSGGIFTIVISKNGIAPTNANMMINDTARWIDVDSTENVTHRIFVDANGNGILDGWWGEIGRAHV